jgi:hypothetical protein
MTNPVAQITHVTDGEEKYDAIAILCPACKDFHLLPVNTTNKQPSWNWNGNLEAVTLTPSILTKYGFEPPRVCHSFLTDGVWHFLSDCTHEMANQDIPMVPLEDWMMHS